MARIESSIILVHYEPPRSGQPPYSVIEYREWFLEAYITELSVPEVMQLVLWFGPQDCLASK